MLEVGPVVGRLHRHSTRQLPRRFLNLPKVLPGYLASTCTSTVSNPSQNAARPTVYIRSRLTPSPSRLEFSTAPKRSTCPRPCQMKLMSPGTPDTNARLPSIKECHDGVLQLNIVDLRRCRVEGIVPRRSVHMFLRERASSPVSCSSAGRHEVTVVVAQQYALRTELIWGTSLLPTRHR